MRRYFGVLALASVLSIVQSGDGHSISVPGTNLNSDYQSSKIEKIQVAFSSPASAVCPANATMTVQLFTDKPGSIQYYVMQKGGSISGPYTIESKPRNNGRPVATFTRDILFQNSVNTEYRVSAAGNSGSTQSGWIPLIATCK